MNGYCPRAVATSRYPEAYSLVVMEPDVLTRSVCDAQLLERKLERANRRILELEVWHVAALMPLIALFSAPLPLLVLTCSVFPCRPVYHPGAGRGWVVTSQRWQRRFVTNSFQRCPTAVHAWRWWAQRAHSVAWWWRVKRRWCSRRCRRHHVFVSHVCQVRLVLFVVCAMPGVLAGGCGAPLNLR